MYARIRLREWEGQKEIAAFALKQISKIAILFWHLGKITFAFAWAIFIGPRMVRHIEPGKAPPESYEFDNSHGGGLWR